MAFKSLVAIFAQIMLIQTVFGQCINNLNRLPLSNIGGYGSGSRCGSVNGTPASGGGFNVISGSPLSPSGLAAYSENGIEGVLSVTGNLPFASAVAVEGSLPTAGQASSNYGCGNAVSLASAGNGVGLSGSGSLAGYGSLGGYNILPSGAGCGRQL